MMEVLLDSHALGQITGLIDVTAAQDSHIVGEQLQGHDELQRHQQVFVLVQPDDIIRHALRHYSVFRGEQNDPGPAALGLLGVGDGLLIHLLLSGQRNDGHTIGDEADGAVLELAGRIGIRVDIADLFQLEAAPARGHNQTRAR